MDSLIISAASGMRARLESLEMLANNLANAATTGYKSDREFYGLYVAPEALDPALAGSSPMPSTLPVIERPWTDFAQGNLTPTDNPLDVALATKGFFVVSGPSGPLYTRNGNFRLSTSGALTTIEGYPVRATNGLPVQTQGAGPLEISTDGTVRQDGVVLGQLAIVDFDKPGGIEKFGRNYFRPVDASLTPGAAAEVEVRQGRLEASNVATPEAAIRLVGLMRQFEMLQKAMILGGEMDRRAMEEVARVTP